MINDDNIYRLSSIECKPMDKKRMVKCITNDRPPYVILHECSYLPLKASPVHSNILNLFSTS
jgi:hypothetical protein